MRIWDLDPGYLNRQSLLGEHRELHGIVSILINGRKGYANHPETRRWRHYGWALKMRHRQLACEMALRGYTERSPVNGELKAGQWPTEYIDPPLRQFSLLREKYRDKEGGRIPLPDNAQQLWSQHKYSVLARDPNLYRRLGPELAEAGGDMAELAALLVRMLRTAPSEGSLRNALQHMWGYVSDPPGGDSPVDAEPRALLRQTQERALARQCRYLLSSTALSELMAWLPPAEG